jgi:hypothetical protein
MLIERPLAIIKAHGSPPPLDRTAQTSRAHDRVYRCLPAQSDVHLVLDNYACSPPDMRVPLEAGYRTQALIPERNYQMTATMAFHERAKGFF